MNATIAVLSNATDVHELNATTTVEEAVAAACGGTHFPEITHDCLPQHQELNLQERFLAVLSIALACAVCALCVLVMLLTALVHKLSTLWVKALVHPAVAATPEPTDDPRKGLLQETKSCMREASGDSSSSSDGQKKKKRASFAEDTSCAPPRDIDEEDL
tara:strand:+ start:163 stop:642 length:480 start_codon:yes stop_codon:yes gene_type:complete